MNAYIKKLFSDWQTYVMIISTVMMVFVDCQDCDYLSAVWVILAFVLWCTNYIFQIYLTEYRRTCNRYEEQKSEAQIIMTIQSETIKLLSDKLDEQTKSNENGVRDTELDQSGERSEKNMG